LPSTCGGRIEENTETSPETYRAKDQIFILKFLFGGAKNALMCGKKLSFSAHYVDYHCRLGFLPAHHRMNNTNRDATSKARWVDLAAGAIAGASVIMIQPLEVVKVDIFC